MPPGQKVGVFIVEDSPTTRLLLTEIINADSRLRVIGVAGSGEEAIEALREVKPEVVLMDVYLPGIDGFIATRTIMETNPLPIIICSGSAQSADAANIGKAVEAGAVSIIDKPVGKDHPGYKKAVALLVQTIALMSEVRVVKRWAKVKAEKATPELIPVISEAKPQSALKLVAIGASTGGPPALQAILGALEKEFDLPVLIVQHISAGFLPGLVEWLQQTTGFVCRIASHNEPLRPRTAYFSPDGYQMGVTVGHRIALYDTPPENGLRPSISYLFRSVTAVYGSTAAGVLLTGMGKDGAQELKELKDTGAVTIAQSLESSVIHGMPGEAIRLGGVTAVLPLEQIGPFLAKIAQQPRRPELIT